MKTKKIVFVPVGGLGNRMMAICSVASLCKYYKKSLEIIWFKDNALNATFHSLFRPIELDDVKLREASFIDYLMFDRPRKHNLYIPEIYQKAAFKKCIYENDAFRRHLNNDDFSDLSLECNIYMASFSRIANSDINDFSFKPASDIQENIDRLKKQIGEKCIGIHIRRGDNIYSIKGSPISSFISKMDKELSNDPDLSFYLATDSEEVKKELYQIYGDRIISFDRPADRLSESGMKDALTELYLLASTKKIFGSFRSTFSQVAAEIGKIPFEEIRDPNTR